MPFLCKDDGHDWPAMGQAVWDRTVAVGTPGLCELCGKVRVRYDQMRKENVHHVTPRSKGGDDSLQNTVLSCASMQFYGGEDFSCHTWIGNNPKEARSKGWLK